MSLFKDPNKNLGMQFNELIDAHARLEICKEKLAEIKEKGVKDNE